MILLIGFYICLVLNSAEINFFDRTDSSKIKNVNVFENNTFFGKSNSQGKFEFDFNKNTILIYKHIAYQTYYDTINSKEQIINIFLSEKEHLIEEIVTTGSFSPQNQYQSVYNVDVISNEQIEAQKAPTLRELLQNTTNVKISNDMSLGSSIQINGVGGQNVKILRDGVPIVGREAGNVNISQISLSNTEKVEIIKGPMSAIYGSDALGGVINIISKKNTHANYSVNFKNYAESVGMVNNNISGNYRKDKSNFSIDAGRNFFSGFTPNNKNIRADQWDPKVFYFANGNYDYRLNNSNINYKIDFTNEFILNRSEPIDSPYNETGLDDEYTTNRITNTLNYNGLFNSFNNFDLTASYQFYQRIREKYIKNLITLDRNLVDAENSIQINDYQNFFFRGIFNFNQFLANQSDFFKDYNLMAGIESNFDKTNGFRIKDGFQDIQDIAFFTNLTINHTDLITIQPTLRVIYNSKYDAPIIPSLHLKSDITKNLTLRGSVSQGYRSPGLKELYLEFIDQNHFVIGNSDLGAENSLAYNFSANYSFFTSGNIFRTELKLFRNVIDNMISLANSGVDELTQQQIFTYQNIDQFKSQGLELGFNYFRDAFTINFNFASIGRWSYLSEDYLYTPEVSANFIHNIKDYNIRLAVLYKYTGMLRQIGLATTIDEQTGDIIENDQVEFNVEDWHNMDITISKTFFNNLIDVSAGVKNLFDVTNLNQTIQTGGVHNSSGTNPINWGRSYYLSFNLSIN